MTTIADMLALAWQFQQAGHLLPAQQLCQQIIQTDSAHADAYHLLGVLAYQQGDAARAADLIRHAIALNPSVAGFHCNLGLAHEGLGKLQEAATHYQDSLKLEPTGADAHNNLGHVFQRLGRLEESERHCRQALAFRPHFAEAHNNLGLALLGQGLVDDATSCFKHALQINRYYAEAWNSLGTVREQLGNFEEAQHNYEQALSLQPTFVAAHNNLGNVFKQRGLLDDALKSYGEALRLDPHHVQVRFNRALIHLLRGDFAHGWREYEWRRAHPRLTIRHFPQPQWDGATFAGRTLLLHAEQGFGDTFQFIRYAPMVKQRGGCVVLECQPQLQSLLETAAGIDQVVAQGSPLPAFDVQTPLLSLPGIFQTSLATIPATVPYLHADGALTAHWRQGLDPQRGFRVGIAWQGRPSLANDAQRSIPLARFEPLASIAGVQLVSVQHGAGAEQLAKVASQFPVLDLGSRFDANSFADAAAAFMSLDLIITVDTAAAHLAGALGRPVWVLVPFAPDWRWLLHRDDSPWYPGMRLFRQSQLGRWDDVFQRVAAELTVVVKMHQHRELPKQETRR